MTNNPMKFEAQATLDDLMQKNQLPFKLQAWTVVSEGSQHTIRFYDSRIHSVAVTYEPGQSFKELIRAAVLDRVSRLSSPLKRD